MTERAKYRVLATAGFFAPNDTLYEEGEEIYFDGEPNEEFEPLNELARERMTVYIAKLDKLAEEAAKKAGIPYNERPKSEDGSYALATAVQKAEMSVLGAQKNDSSVERAEKKEVPLTGKRRGKRGRLELEDLVA
jgi:hypothetical protein